MATYSSVAVLIGQLSLLLRLAVSVAMLRLGQGWICYVPVLPKPQQCTEWANCYIIVSIHSGFMPYLHECSTVSVQLMGSMVSNTDSFSSMNTAVEEKLYFSCNLNFCCNTRDVDITHKLL